MRKGQEKKRGGWGVTYQEVYLSDKLTIEAKAIYGMLCSLAGTGNTAYPTVTFMCDKLQISRARFYKHMNLLIAAGVVEKKMTYENGLRSNNVYVLTPNRLKRDYQQLGNVTVDMLTVDNIDTNNNTINNNTLNNINTNIVQGTDAPCADSVQSTAGRRT